MSSFLSESLFKSLLCFLMGGYGLINWNVILNTTQYFNHLALFDNFSNIFQFLYMAGQVVSFLFAWKIFKKTNPFKYIVFNMLISFGLMIILVFFFKIFTISIPLGTTDPEKLTIINAAHIFFLIFMFFNGVSQNCVQSEFCRIISSMTQQNVNEFNAGNGFNGFFISLISFFLYLGLMRGDEGQNNGYFTLPFADKLAIDYKIMMYFLIVYCIMVLASVLIFIFYHKKYPKLMSWPESQIEQEFAGTDVKEQLQLKSMTQIILEGLDVYFTMFTQYFFVLVNLVYFAIQTTLKQPDYVFSIPFYMLMFSLGDFLGKFIPAKVTIKSIGVTYLISIFFPLISVYFYSYLYFTQEGNWIQNQKLKAAVILLMGLVNGYNTNNIFYSAIQRQNGPNKGTAGYLCVLFLLFGIIAATINGIVYPKSE